MCLSHHQQAQQWVLISTSCEYLKFTKIKKDEALEGGRL